MRLITNGTNAVLSLTLLFVPAFVRAAAAATTGEIPETVDVPNYLGNLYIWMFAFVGISALFAVVMGGVLYMFSGTSLTKVDSAKRWIWNAIFGIIIAATSYLLLYVINPDLVTHGFDLEEVLNAACGGDC